MKNLVLLLALGATACQPATPPVARASAPATAPADSAAQAAAAEAAFMLADSLRRSNPLRLLPLGAADTLTADDKQFVRSHDFSLLWRAQNFDRPMQRPMEGFYGPNHYRISVYFDQVWRDSLRSDSYLVGGRDRYRKVITPFYGTITVQRIVWARLDVDNSYQPTDSVRTFVVRARYEFAEDPATKGAGIYRGEALLDAYEDQHGQLRLADIWGTSYNPTRGGGLLFRGDWTDMLTGRRRSAAWAADMEAVAPQPVMEEQQAGGRTGDVDPVLARLGWNEFWENDEWWAKSPKPKLSL